MSYNEVFLELTAGASGWDSRFDLQGRRIGTLVEVSQQEAALEVRGLRSGEEVSRVRSAITDPPEISFVYVLLFGCALSSRFSLLYRLRGHEFSVCMI